MADQITGLFSPFLRSRRIAAVRPFLGTGTVLEIGCGTGPLAPLIDPAKYLGVDRDDESIAIARKRLPAHRFVTLAEFVSTQNETRFDQIVGLAVIEHVDDPKEWLSWLRTFLKPDGCIIMTTPHPSIRSFHEFGASIGLFSREGAKEHRRLIDRERMAALAAASGFRVRKFRPFLFGCNQLFVLEPN